MRPLLPYDVDDILTSQWLQRAAVGHLGRDLLPAQVTPGARVYLRRWHSGWSLHDQIRVPYHLLSNCHDDSIAGAIAERYLEDDRVLSWTGVNAVAEHPKLHPIPRGLWRAPGDWVPRDPPATRDWLLYANFAMHSPARVEAKAWLASRPWVVWRSYRGMPSLAQYGTDLARSRFVLAPPGYGWDCWRTWEALACGAIPVLLRSPIDRLYADMPVLLIDGYEQLTPAFLEDAEARMLAGVAAGQYPATRLSQGWWAAHLETVAPVPASDAMPDEDWLPGDRWARRREALNGHYFPCLTRFIRERQIRSVVEIGVRAGYSMAAMLRGNPRLTYLGIDDDRGSWGGVPGGLAHAEVLRQRYAKGEARFWRADSQRLTELPGRFDMAYVDGDHSVRGCRHDLELVAPYVRWILADDFHGQKGVHQAVEAFCTAHGWAYETLPSRYGWALIDVTQQGSDP